jgi:hypothetical protein
VSQTRSYKRDEQQQKERLTILVALRSLNVSSSPSCNASISPSFSSSPLSKSSFWSSIFLSRSSICICFDRSESSSSLS